MVDDNVELGTEITNEELDVVCDDPSPLPVEVVEVVTLVALLVSASWLVREDVEEETIGESVRVREPDRLKEVRVPGWQTPALTPRTAAAA